MFDLLTWIGMKAYEEELRALEAERKRAEKEKQ